MEETNIKLEEKEETINNHKKAIDKHKKVLDILSDRAEKNEQTEAFDKMRIVYNDLINKCIEYDLPSGKLFKNFDVFNVIQNNESNYTKQNGTVHLS